MGGYDAEHRGWLLRRNGPLEETVLNTLVRKVIHLDGKEQVYVGWIECCLVFWGQEGAVNFQVWYDQNLPEPENCYDHGETIKGSRQGKMDAWGRTRTENLDYFRYWAAWFALEQVRAVASEKILLSLKETDISK